jgi:hypothetical protein
LKLFINIILIIYIFRPKYSFTVEVLGDDDEGGGGRG